MHTTSAVWFDQQTSHRNVTVFSSRVNADNSVRPLPGSSDAARMARMARSKPIVSLIGIGFLVPIRVMPYPEQE
jgi:hypothetical protein